MSEQAKYFNNVIIGQFALTGIPLKVFVEGRYLIITGAEDVEDVHYGFGMNENGEMLKFDYFQVQHLLVSGEVVDLLTYNKAMEGGGEEAPDEEPAKDEEKKEESVQLKTEITKDVLKAKLDVIKQQEKELADKEKALKKEPIEDAKIPTLAEVMKEIGL